ASAGPVRFEVRRCEIDLTRAAASWDDAVDELEVTARGLTVDKELFKYLPELKEYQDDYAPAGRMSVGLEVRRAGPGRCRRRWDLPAQDMTATYPYFPYPLPKLPTTTPA